MNTADKKTSNDPASTTAVIETVCRYLDHSQKHISTEVSQQLAQTRQRALHDVPGVNASRWAAPAYWLIPALAAGWLLWLAAPGWLDSASTSQPALANVPELAGLPENQQLDILENMDFYLWLEQQGQLKNSQENS